MDRRLVVDGDDDGGDGDVGIGTDEECAKVVSECEREIGTDEREAVVGVAGETNMLRDFPCECT